MVSRLSRRRRRCGRDAVIPGGKSSTPGVGWNGRVASHAQRVARGSPGDTDWRRSRRHVSRDGGVHGGRKLSSRRGGSTKPLQSNNKTRRDCCCIGRGLRSLYTLRGLLPHEPSAGETISKPGGLPVEPGDSRRVASCSRALFQPNLSLKRPDFGLAYPRGIREWWGLKP